MQGETLASLPGRFLLARSADFSGRWQVTYLRPGIDSTRTVHDGRAVASGVRIGRAGDVEFRSGEESAVVNDETRLSANHTAWLELQREQVRGEGTVIPRLIVDMRMRTPRERIRVRVGRLEARLSVKGEFLGAATTFGTDEVTHHRSAASLEFRLTREAWAFLSDRPPEGDSMVLQLDLSGQMDVWHDIDETEEPQVWPRPPRQAWTMLAIDTTEFRIFVPRSEWLSRVVEPINRTEVLMFELETRLADAIPGLRKALDHLQRARRHYVEGHDAEAVGACYSALEALPGAPKGIVTAVTDPEKRRHLDALIKAVKDFSHAGRHLTKAEDRAGTFSVEHVDARFAIGLTTVLLTHLGNIH
jgi:hypothetical protein